jgi:hypothetical protein
MRALRHRPSDIARVALAFTRLVNGALGLLAPGWLVRRLGAEPSTSPAALYAFRLFGIRTIMVGLELLLPAGPIRDRAVRIAPLIHASDTIAAAAGGIRGRVPAKAAFTILLISLLNTVLAVLAGSPRRGK